MKPHGFLIYLPPELYLGIIKLQADKQLGRVYPVLLAINEGLYQMGYISKEVYEFYLRKYSEKLIKAEVKPLTPKEELKLQKLTASFKNIIKNWQLTKKKDYWIEKAKKALECFGEEKIPEAKQILALAQKVEADSK